MSLSPNESFISRGTHHMSLSPNEAFRCDSVLLRQASDAVPLSHVSDVARAC